jgi:hypothetical protein
VCARFREQRTCAFSSPHSSQKKVPSAVTSVGLFVDGGSRAETAQNNGCGIMPCLCVRAGCLWSYLFAAK